MDINPERHESGQYDSNTITTDKELVKGIAKSNKECEQLLVIKFQSGLKRLFRRLTRDPSRAEDLTHETLILILQKLRNQELKDPDCLTSYVYSTARFTFLGWRRKKDNQVELTETIDQFECPQSMIERTIMDDELANYLHKEIENLSVDRDRDILQRHYLQEQSKREICDALLLDVDLYDKVICRARQRLKASINPENNALIGLFA